MYFSCHLRRVVLLLVSFATAVAQADPVEIRRAVFENPVSEAAALAGHENAGAEGALPAAIAVRLSDSFSFLWDTVGCRLLAGWSGEFLNEDGTIGATPSILATGESPFSSTVGGGAIPEYYGFELDEVGVPTFQYLVGVLAVAEKIHLSEAGDAVLIDWSIKNSPTGEVMLALPADWETTAQISSGKWDGGYVVFSTEESPEFRVTLPLSVKPEPTPESAEMKPGPPDLKPEEGSPKAESDAPETEPVAPTE